jgi:hypothetical protein
MTAFIRTDVQFVLENNSTLVGYLQVGKFNLTAGVC